MSTAGLHLLHSISQLIKAINKGSIPASAERFLQTYLEIDESDQFKKSPHKSKRRGYVHEHFDQYYKDVKVEGGGYNFHYRDGVMYFANGHYVPIKRLNTIPSINLEEAKDAFLKYKDIAREDIADFDTEIVIKEIQKNKKIAENTIEVVLVYRIYLASDHPENNEIGYVDAHSGKIVITEPRLLDLTGTFSTRYSGSRTADTDPVTGGHRLFDNTRGATIHTRNLQNSTTIITSAVELIDNDNNWTAGEHTANNNDMGLDVHWALQEIYDYLSSTHTISSFDNDDEPIIAYVRFGVDEDNAYWDPTPNVLLFGQGASLFTPLASFDVVAHEFGHGITDFQIGWGASGNEGAFNEGLSDIWGAILEHRLRPSSTWRIGEQVMDNGKSYLRNLQNTNDNNAHQKIEDTFGTTQYNSGNEYKKSGVFSHWFYLLVNGGSGVNGVSDSYSVNGINMDIAEAIIVEAVFNNYLDGTTTYPEVRTAFINAATAICDNHSIIESVTNAWYAGGGWRPLRWPH